MFPTYLLFKKKVSTYDGAHSDGLLSIWTQVAPKIQPKYNKGIAIKMNEKEFNLDKLVTMIEDWSSSLLKVWSSNTDFCLPN